MTSYSAYWRTTIFASIAFHFLMALGFSYVLPHLLPEPTIEDVAEFEWLDVDLSDEVVVVEEETIPVTIPQEQVTLPTFNPQELFVPETYVPEPVFVEEVPPIKPPEIKPIERPQPSPVVTKEEPPAQSKSNEPPKDEVVVPANTKQQLGQPPVTLTEVYPQKGSGLGYKGYVSIAATIGKDGKVKATKIMRTSGRLFVDEIARNAAMQWTFKPALDQNGKPMECDKIITFDFKKFSEA